MNRLLEWLLDLDRVNLQDGGRLSWQWQNPLDAWMWFILVLAVPCYVILIYRRDGGSARARTFMAGSRALIILLMMILLCKPALVYRRDRVEPSTVAVVLDESASMGRTDHYTPETWDQLASILPQQNQTASTARWDIVRALFEDDRQNMLKGLLQTHEELRFFRFAGSLSAETYLQDPAAVDALADQITILRPTGVSTHIAQALKQVFDACIDAHLAGVVLVTDGQPTAESDWETIAQLSTSRGTPIYVIGVGSPHAPKDLALEAVKVDNRVYVGDHVALTCNVRNQGFDNAAPFELLLKNAATGKLLARKTLQTEPEQESRSVELSFEPKVTGRLTLLLEIPPVPGELETVNNAQQLQIDVVDEKIRALYVDGYPRYEYRYLKNTLLREPSVRSSILLLSADEAFVQEGDHPIRRFPNTEEELNQFDVVLFGDVNPHQPWISQTQLEMLAEFVTEHGGGFGMIAGEWYQPDQFFGTPLERIIPVDLTGRAELSQRGHGSFRPRLTAAGRESPVFRLLVDPQDSALVFEQLPSWYWTYAVTGVKPATETLLEHPTRTLQGGALPLVVVGRFGAGTAFFQASDETWRWRRGQGEAFFDTYWLQVIRYLARHKKFRGSSGITLRTQQRVVDPLEPVVIALEFEDHGPAAQLPDGVEAVIRSSAGALLEQLTLTRLSENSRHFQGSYTPEVSGQLEVVFSPRQYGLNADEVGALFEIRAQSLEDLNPQANIELMTMLTGRTEGMIFRPWEAASLAQRIPQQEYIVPDDIAESVWDSKLALLLFVVLIAAEWIVRKRCGLI